MHHFQSTLIRTFIYFYKSHYNLKGKFLNKTTSEIKEELINLYQSNLYNFENLKYLRITTY